MKIASWPCLVLALGSCSGTVLVTGGHAVADTSRAVLFSPAGGGSWTVGPSLLHARYGHTTTTLTDGSVLVVGGENGNWSYTEKAERFYP